MLNREFAEDSIKHTPKRGVPGIGGTDHQGPIGGGMSVNAVSPPVFIEFQSTVLRLNVSLVSDGRHQALSDPCRPCCYKRTSPGSSGAQREVWVGPGQLN